MFEKQPQRSHVRIDVQAIMLRQESLHHLALINRMVIPHQPSRSANPSQQRGEKSDTPSPRGVRQYEQIINFSRRLFGVTNTVSSKFSCS